VDRLALVRVRSTNIRAVKEKGRAKGNSVMQLPVPDQPGQQEDLPQRLTSIPGAKGTKAKMQTAPTRWEIREPALAVGTAGSYTILVNRLRKARKAAPHQPGLVLPEAEPVKVWAKAEVNTKGKVKLVIKR